MISFQFVFVRLVNIRVQSRGNHANIFFPITQPHFHFLYGITSAFQHVANIGTMISFQFVFVRDLKSIMCMRVHFLNSIDDSVLKSRVEMKRREL